MDVKLQCRSCHFRGRKLYEGPVRTWKEHNKELHSADKDKCPRCPMVFSSYKEKNQHVKEDHRKFLCLQCDRDGHKNNYLWEAEFDSHYFEQHKLCKFNCPSCPNKFQLESQVTTHRRYWHHLTDPPRIPCENCKMSFQFKRQMQIHTSDVHKDKPFICTNCHCGFKNKQLRNTHQRGCKIKYE